jgi:transcriptional regulator with XRE-family HTH domain
MRSEPCQTCAGTGSVPVATIEELKAARLSAGLSQAKLGARMGGLSTAYISDLERGQRARGPEIVRRWMVACEADGEEKG